MESLFDKVVGLLLNNIFIKKEIPPAQVFSCEYREIIKNNFFKEHFLLIILSEILSDDKIIWASLGTTLIFFIFFGPLLWFFFIILVLHSGVHGYFVLVFIPTFLVSITFAHFRMPESETTSRIIATSPSNLL